MTPAVKTLLIANGVVFFLNFVIGGRLSDLFSVSWHGLGQGYGLGIVKLISYQFVHSRMDVMHILLNMMVLFFFGTMVESEVGRRGLFRLYLISGVFGAILQLLLGLSLGVDPEVVGASGSCYGIMVYAACMAPRMKVIFLIFPVEMRWLVGFLIFVGVYDTALSLTGGPRGGVAHGAHLGGALWGFLAFRYFRSIYRPAEFRPGGLLAKFRGWSAGRARKSEAKRREILDRLLDKVHREGMNSLSSAERRFLENESRRQR